jgi:hypothetical protein
MKSQALDSCFDMICKHMVCAISSPEDSYAWKWRWQLVETWLAAAANIIEAE